MMRIHWSVFLRSVRHFLRRFSQRHTRNSLILLSRTLFRYWTSFWIVDCSLGSSYAPSQADVATFKALKSTPEPANYPHAYRWYKHITSHEHEFSSLPGDPSKLYTAYGPELSELPTNTKTPTAAPAAKAEDDEDEDDLFGSDESEDEEAKKVKEANLAAYKKKKEGKAKPAAKSMVTLDVKPWGRSDRITFEEPQPDILEDDETDMKALEKNMRAIEMDGLTWGASKFVPVGYGISKLQVNLVVEDEKVSIDDLQAQIEGDEDHVQSTDVVGPSRYVYFVLVADHAFSRLLCQNSREHDVDRRR